MAQATRFAPEDKELELLASLEISMTHERVAAEQLANPRHSMLYPAYKRLANAREALRVKCHEKSLAIRMHRSRNKENQ
jgi:hypothetical protein